MKMKQIVNTLLLCLLLCSCRVQQPITSDSFVSDFSRDIPFKTISLSKVADYEDVYAFRCNGYVDLLPDYEVNADGASAVYRTSFMPSQGGQKTDVIWRNIIINRKAKRVLCVDRFVDDGNTFGYIYILQSETKDYSDRNTYHWDVSDQSLMLTVAAVIDGMTSLSVTQLEIISQK